MIDLYQPLHAMSAVPSIYCPSYPLLPCPPPQSRADTYAALTKLLALLDDPFTRHLAPERLEALRRGNAGEEGGGGSMQSCDL